jgi:CheY-like chemotaxis protein
MMNDSHKKILVVDDDPVNRLVVRLLMERRGCIVIEAPSGQEALDIVELNRFDVILMDLSMPCMDGFETTKRLREGNKIARSMPIFALTAHSSRENEKKCQNSGLNGILSKPFDTVRADQLLSLICSPTDPLPA